MTLHFGDGSSITTFASLPAIDGSALTGLAGGGNLKGLKWARNSSQLTSPSTGYTIPTGQTNTFTVPEAGDYILVHSYNYTFQRSSNQTNTNSQGRIMKNGSEHYFWIGREEIGLNNRQKTSPFQVAFNSSYLTGLSANDTVEVRIEYRSNGGGSNTRTRLIAGGYMINMFVKL